MRAYKRAGAAADRCAACAFSPLISHPPPHPTPPPSVLAAVLTKTATLVQRLCAMFPQGLPVGVPAGALPVSFTGALPMAGIVGDSAGAALKAGFRDTLQRNGMGSLIGNASGEGFLWQVCGAEPQLQALASQAVAAAAAAAAAAAGKA
jgi:hypothetical protein